MRSPKSVSRFLPLLLAAALPAQRTWIVDVAKGPGWNFADVQSAVTAATKGDIVVVRAGSYAQAVTITKGLAVLCEANVSLGGKLTIQALAAGERVVVRNVGFFDGSANVLSGLQPIVCESCVGTVHLEDIRGGGSWNGPALTVKSCSQVTAIRSQLSAGYTTSVTSGLSLDRSWPQPGVVATNSALLLVSCTMNGSANLDRLARPQNAGGMTASVSRVVLVDCVVSGAAGSPPYTFPQPGLQASISAITIAGARSVITGSGGGFLEALPVQADAATTILRDASLSFLVAGGQLTTQVVASTDAFGAAPGNTATCRLSYAGTAGSATFISYPGGPIPYQAIGVWIDVPMLLQVDAGIVSGQRTILLPVPAFLPRGLPAAFQSVLLDNNNVLVSTPATTILS